MANALHTTEKSLKQRISNLKKEQYILVAIVTYHGFFSKKKKKARVMAAPSHGGSGLKFDGMTDMLIEAVVSLSRRGGLKFLA